MYTYYDKWFDGQGDVLPTMTFWKILLS